MFIFDLVLSYESIVIVALFSLHDKIIFYLIFSRYITLYNIFHYFIY